MTTPPASLQIRRARTLIVAVFALIGVATAVSCCVRAVSFQLNMRRAKAVCRDSIREKWSRSYGNVQFLDGETVRSDGRVWQVDGDIRAVRLGANAPERVSYTCAADYVPSLGNWRALIVSSSR
jgi:hypothetical protein